MSCPTCSWDHTSFLPAVACYLGRPVADLAPQPPRVLGRAYAPEGADVETWEHERAASLALMGAADPHPYQGSGTPPERLVTAPRASRFKGGFRNGRTALRKPPGRPRKHDDNGDRQRAYRARKTQARVAANEVLLTGAPA